MKKFLFVAGAVVLFSCHSSSIPKINQIDTVIVAYAINNNWHFSTASVWAHAGRTWLTDSGLDGKIDVVRQIRLQSPPIKGDSIMDSITHKLLKINLRYDNPLPDSINKYIHILDTIRTGRTR